MLFDAASRGRYATDASIYQIEPVGVVIPRTEDAARVALAAEAGVPILPRGAGTSQCGQTVGAALVIDNSKHLDKVLELDVGRREAVVQPGLVLDQLSARLRPHSLWFPVDVSTPAQATLGGMAGNNSCGARSIRYGNMVHNVLGIEAWLATGEVLAFGPVGSAGGADPGRALAARIDAIVRREAAEIRARWPTVLRRAVPLEHLVEYTDRLTKVFEKHSTRGTWYAHASVGTLHVRPVLNMKADGARKMRAIAEEACAMVREFKGAAFSGEHGDGLVRSEWIEPILGPRIVRALEDIKAVLDPKGLMNPGKIVRPTRMDDAALLRFKPGYATQRVNPALDWSEWGPNEGGAGFAAAVEMCNNNGHCRKFDAGTMCPSFRATGDERHLTRGRANTLRLALSGQLGPGALVSGELYAAMDLCVGCKGCKRECPTGVDMARMKVEFLHHYHGRHGYRARDRGAAGERDVVLLVDTFTNAFEPENARAAVRVLEVEVVEPSCCGMAGAFGYDASHYDVSLRMAEASLLPAVRAVAPDTLVVADGTSCRHQIRDFSAREAQHVARVLERALA
ncbi:MAG: FAD-binding protein [Burkholderiales bacterium]|nr:FAD-binding protein [Burkholderiales bacterium]